MPPQELQPLMAIPVALLVLLVFMKRTLVRHVPIEVSCECNN